MKRKFPFLNVAHIFFCLYKNLLPCCWRIFSNIFLYSANFLLILFVGNRVNFGCLGMCFLYTARIFTYGAKQGKPVFYCLWLTCCSPFHSFTALMMLVVDCIYFQLSLSEMLCSVIFSVFFRSSKY